MRCPCGAPLYVGMCATSRKLRDACDAPTEVKLRKQPNAFADATWRFGTTYLVIWRADVLGVVTDMGADWWWGCTRPTIVAGQARSRDEAVDQLLQVRA